MSSRYAATVPGGDGSCTCTESRSPSADHCGLALKVRSARDQICFPSRPSTLSVPAPVSLSALPNVIASFEPSGDQLTPVCPAWSSLAEAAETFTRYVCCTGAPGTAAWTTTRSLSGLQSAYAAGAVAPGRLIRASTDCGASASAVASASPARPSSVLPSGEMLAKTPVNSDSRVRSPDVVSSRHQTCASPPPHGPGLPEARASRHSYTTFEPSPLAPPMVNVNGRGPMPASGYSVAGTTQASAAPVSGSRKKIPALRSAAIVSPRANLRCSGAGVSPGAAVERAVGDPALVALASLFASPPQATASSATRAVARSACAVRRFMG